jgi:putative nucleotidyltransferase with HDIG domain
MDMRSVEWARSEATRLVEPLGPRWLHVRSVASCAERVTEASGFEREVLVASAWLHDVGYADEVHDTGFHPVDGARHLRRLGVEERIVNLVAHHSCARFEAIERGMEAEFLTEFPRPPAAYEDALCYCDMTNGPAGDRVAAADRLDEIQARYGPGHPVTRFVDAARGEILSSVARVEERLGVSESQASRR